MQIRTLLGWAVVSFAVATIVWINTGNWLFGHPELQAPAFVELGELEYDEFRRFAIPVKNVGGGVLKLTLPGTSCSCTIAELERDSLQHGEVGEVTVVYHATQSPGAATLQTVVLNSNCRRSKQNLVSLKGRMRGGVFAVPSAIEVTREIGENWNREIELIHSNPDVLFRIMNSRIDLPGCNVAFDDKAASSHLIRVSSEKCTLIGSTSGAIDVETDQKVSSVIRIPLAIEVRSSVDYSPKPLILSIGSNDEAVEELNFRGRMRFGLTPLASIPALVVTRTTPNIEGENHRFEIRVVTNSSVVKRGTIDFQIEGLPNETQLSIPYLIVP